SGDSHGKILQWSIRSGVIKADTIMKSQHGVHVIEDLVLSPDNRYLLAAGDFELPETYQKYMQVIDLQNNNAVRNITGFTGEIKDIEVLDATSRYFILSEKGRNIQEVDIQTGTVIDFINPGAKVNDLNISPDGRYMAGAGANGEIFVWDINNNNELVPYLGNSKAEYTSIRFSSDGKYLVVGELGGNINLFNTSTKSLIRIFADFQQMVTDIKFSPDGHYMAVSSYAKQIRVWNMRNLSDQPYVMDLDGWANSMSFSSDSRFLFGGASKGGEIRVWPMNIEVMANKLCSLITRGLAKEEWIMYVDEISEDYPYDGETCNMNK
ncbi:MAG: hypothetical protein ABFS32_22335, partial [Bacteroidota bacterium]